MPRNPDMPCASCGRSMWRGRGSLPEGEATCQPCRRKATALAKPPPKKALEDKACAICGHEFTQKVATQIYCSPSCREARRPNWTEHTATATERGYGAEHQRERRRWKPIVDAGRAHCCLCGYWIEPGTKWHLDHTPDRTGYRGVAHATCNVRDGARRGAQRTPRPRMDKTCATCGRMFNTIYPRQSYCSRDCRPTASRAPRPPSPPREVKACWECGEPTTRRVYCSTTCSSIADRKSALRNRTGRSFAVTTR